MNRAKCVTLLFFLIVLLAVVPGYSQDKKKIDKYFDMTIFEMMDVEIVTAGRTPEKVSDIPASVVVITRDDIEKYGYSTLAEILENIPGLFAINDYGEGGANFGVRGFWSGVPNDNMIILVNGVSQVDDLHSNYPISKIPVPVEAIEKIEVVRGPMSVIYGHGAFFGVINIFTNDFIEEKDHGGTRDNKPLSMVSTSIGSQRTKKVFLRTAGREGAFQYVFNASFFDTYGIDEPLSKMVKDTAGLPVYGVPEDYTTGGILENEEKYFNFAGFFDNFYVDISHIQSNRETLFLFPSPSRGHQNRFVTSNVALAYRNKISDSFSIDLKLAYMQNRLWQNYDFFEPTFYGLQQLESTAWEMDFNLFAYPTKNLEIKTGIYNRTVLNVSNMYDLPSFGSESFMNNYFSLSDDSNISTRAIYTQVGYKPFSKLNLVAGVRLEQMPRYTWEGILAAGTGSHDSLESTYDEDKIEVIPRFAAILDLNDKHIFKLLYGTAINRPSFFQVYNNTRTLYLNQNDFVVPLSSEKIQTLELNYTGAISNQFTFGISYFHNVLDNLITRIVQVDYLGNYQTWSDNAGEMVTDGVELTVKAEPFKNLRLELSGTYQETRDNKWDYDVAYSPMFLGYLKIAYSSKNLAFSLTGNYVDGMETYWDQTLISEEFPDGQRIGESVSGYFVLGANLRMENLLLKGMFLNVRCYNILDEEIRYPTFTNNTWANRGTIGLGRSFLVTLGYKF